MSKTSRQPPSTAWVADSQLALELYLEALESEQARQSIMESVLAQMRERLELAPREETAPSIAEIRAMFARYQSSLNVPTKSIAQLVADMREE